LAGLKTVRIMLRVAVAAASIGRFSPAMAHEDGLSQPSGVVALAPAEQRPAGPIDTRSDSSPWLFPPIDKYLDQQAGR